ncbi:MAG: hypothetical protein J2P34_12790, partial [Actinobacteria bacterium]|nr:hypothetical protein [Actinomycetota bacterium]
MTGRDVPDADMPNSFGQQGAGAGPESESAEALDALLAGALPPDDVTTGLRPVADLLAALSAPPEPDELAGHGQMLAAFRQWAAGTASMPVNGHRGPASRARPASLARLATRARPASRARHASLARRAGNRGRGHRPVTALPA